MAATMKTMEWRIVDTLYPDQLEIGDNIYTEDGLAEIVEIIENADGITVNVVDEYGDILEVDFSDNDMVDIFMLFDED